MLMLAAEPPTPPPVLSVPSEQGDPDPALTAAVNDLYRACHLPPPAMLIARCGDDFVQLMAMMTFRPVLAVAPLLLALFYPCLFLAILTLAGSPELKTGWA
jgi:hypothetical protein